MTDSARLENIPLSLELVRISNHVLKVMIKANSWRNRSKTIPTKSDKSCGMMGQYQQNCLSDFFQNLRYFSVFSVIILVEYFVHFKLCKCYWILINFFLKFNKV